MAEPRRCGAKTRSGGTCQKQAGWGTDHQGWGHCRLHLGTTETGREHAARQEIEAVRARAAAAVMGDPRSTDPADALQLCLDITRAEVEWLTGRIRELEQDEAAGPVVTRVERNAHGGENAVSYTQETQGPPAANVWIKLRREAVRDLARYAELMQSAGFAERRLRLAEAEGAAQFELYQKVFDAIDATTEQRRIGEGVIYGHLQLIEGSAEELAA